MGLSMRERKAVRRETGKRYGRAKKKEKGRMPDEFCAVTGYNRCYAARVLNERGRAIGRETRGKERRGRGKKYGPEVLEPLKRLGAIADGICGKRLAAILPELIDRLERFGEMRLAAQVGDLLRGISASTIDRLLAPERKRMQLKRRCGTKPGSLLKSRIQMRTLRLRSGQALRRVG